MKKIFIKGFAGLALSMSMVSCGDSFLETDIFNGVDLDSGLQSATTVGYALNGTYYRLFYYYFAGNYATVIGDIASDITYWNQDTNHFNALYTFTYDDTNSYLEAIWNYGYKVIDNSARIIQACENLLPEANGNDEIYLKLYEAEARCLRAYASQALVNIFCHQVKVNGQDYSSQPGIVVVDKPIEAYAEVERGTIGETYAQITGDLQKAISLYEEIGGDQEYLYYFGEASAYGLLARANMYLENWNAAASAAESAIAISGIDELAYTAAEYKALYNNNYSNWESMFALAITSSDNWSANSCGTLFTTYGYSESPYLLSLYGEDDCRLSIMTFNQAAGDPFSSAGRFNGGKFGYYGGSNPAYATNYLVNAPEMYLIMAEAYANLGQISDAQDVLYVVAHRNPAIGEPTDLPSTKDSILSFLRDERARELFQEGFRLWDLRRWGVTCSLNAYDGPNITFQIKNVNVSDLVFPIPAAEVNAGFGVTQNQGWASTRPQ